MPSLRVIDGSDISGDKNTKRSRSHKINNKQTHFNHSVYLNDAAAAVARGFKHSQKTTSCRCHRSNSSNIVKK